jgi:hypothetical protein
MAEAEALHKKIKHKAMKNISKTKKKFFRKYFNKSPFWAGCL